MRRGLASASRFSFLRGLVSALTCLGGLVSALTSVSSRELEDEDSHATAQHKH